VTRTAAIRGRGRIPADVGAARRAALVVGDGDNFVVQRTGWRNDCAAQGDGDNETDNGRLGIQHPSLTITLSAILQACAASTHCAV
jgi:hypothetical protein